MGSHKASITVNLQEREPVLCKYCETETEATHEVIVTSWWGFLGQTAKHPVCLAHGAALKTELMERTQ